MRATRCRRLDLQPKLAGKPAIPARPPVTPADQKYAPHEQVRTAQPSPGRPTGFAQIRGPRACANPGRGRRTRRRAVARSEDAADPERGPYHPDEPDADDVPGSP